MNSADADGEALAKALGRHDPDVLDSLIERYHYRLYRYLLALSRRRDIADDLFQETWIRILQRGHQYNGKSRFDAWLFAIARNLMIDRLRREQPAISLDSRSDGDVEDMQPSIAVAAGETAHEIISRKEEEEWIAGALRELPPAQREVLVLRYQDDLPLEEIARITSAPLSTVKSRVYRGLELLRDFMDGRR